MAEDIQGLLEKINRDGVEKARAEGERIVAEAKARAEALVAEAKSVAAAAKAEAERAAKDYESRARESLAQAARDTVLKVEASVTAALEKLLAKDVDAALADAGRVAALVAEAVRGLAGAEVVAGPTLAAALKAQLASLGEVKVTLDESFGAGFTVRVDGGRVEHSFTGAVVAEELAKRLRPDLAALLK